VRDWLMTRTTPRPRLYVITVRSSEDLFELQQLGGPISTKRLLADTGSLR